MSDARFACASCTEGKIDAHAKKFAHFATCCFCGEKVTTAEVTKDECETISKKRKAGRL